MQTKQLNQAGERTQNAEYFFPEHFCNYSSPSEARRHAKQMNELAETERARIAALPAHVRSNHGAGFMNVTLYRYSAGKPVVSDECRALIGDAEVAKMGGMYRAKLMP